MSTFVDLSSEDVEVVVNRENCDSLVDPNGVHRILDENSFDPLESDVELLSYFKFNQTDFDELFVPNLAIINTDTPAFQNINEFKPTSRINNGYKVIHFNGISEHLSGTIDTTVGNPNFRAKQFGIGMWVRASQFNTDNVFISMMDVAGSGNDVLIFEVFNDQLRAVLYNNADNSATVTASENLNTNEWMFITFEYDGFQDADERLIISKNCDLLNLSSSFDGISELPNLLAFPSNGSNFLIGTLRNDASATGFWKGRFGPNLFFFRGQLTAAQRKQFMNFERPI